MSASPNWRYRPVVAGAQRRPVSGMIERSGSAPIIAGASEDPVPRSPVKPQGPPPGSAFPAITCLHR
jgi:hypothetical protein